MIEDQRNIIVFILICFSICNFILLVYTLKLLFEIKLNILGILRELVIDINNLKYVIKEIELKRIEDKINKKGRIIKFLKKIFFRI